MKRDDKTLQLIDYWRNSLADASRMDIKYERSDQAEKIDRWQIREGQISPEMTEQIIFRANETTGARKLRQPVIDLSGGEESTETVPFSVDVVICPVIAVQRKTYRLSENERERILTPLWITAKLLETGAIEPPGEPLVWIPREILEPAANTLDTIGDIDAVDKFLSQNPHPQNAANREDPPRWEDLWRYAEQMLRAVTDHSFESFQYDDYETLLYSLVIPESEPGSDRMRQGITDLYARLKQRAERSKPLPKLFRAFASLKDTELEPLLTGVEHIKASASHLGQMALKDRFALSVSQREALHHFLRMKDGEILAVNGPPGTGKTTLLQSVVANLWIEAALNGKRQPPVIVAASTNNQAVTNIIEDFGKQPVVNSPLTGRWLPGIASYGLYCPSASRLDGAAAYQITFAGKTYPDNGFFLPGHKHSVEKSEANPDARVNVEDEEFVIAAETFFMSRCGGYAGREFSSVEEATGFLRTELISVTDSIKTGLHLWLDRERLGQSESRPEKAGAEDSVWHKILSFFGLSKDSRAGEAQNSETVGRAFGAWQLEFNLNSEPPDLLGELDKTLRCTAFQLATHYWEGAWLVEMREQFSGGFQEKKSVEKQKKRWRRYAKLAPCFVSTFYQLPKFFSAWEGADIPLFEFIDLLIVDEAGQVSPEVAAASFALAKKALIVGDVLQIEPVRQLTERVDAGNIERHRLADSDDEIALFHDSGLSVTGGSVMKIAQRASRYRKRDERGEYERGMFLAEHRRCLPEIISYCNELAYKGRLIPKRELTTEEKDRKMWLPAMGYAHIESQSRKIGGSRDNLTEAEIIVQWILDNKERLEDFYGKKDLAELIGIVTPFRAQSDLLKKELKRNGLFQSSRSEFKVGSVHTFQGAEKPVVIFSPVHGTDDNRYFFDGKLNMLNVAVSRAKDSFLVFGNCRIFTSEAAQRPGRLLAKHLFADPQNKIII